MSWCATWHHKSGHGYHDNREFLKTSRVASELERWDIAIDDSAGRPLSHTQPGTFLCLLAEAADAGFAPVPLLALLKHPLATMGGDGAAFRENARRLDVLLRGPRPDADLDGIARLIKDPDLAAWFAKVSDTLRPLGEALAGRELFIADAVALHLDAAEKLSSRDQLWRGEAGDKAAELFTKLSEASADLPAIEPGAYVPLFRDFASRIAIRPAYGNHPRLAILGAQEARLLNFDLVVGIIWATIKLLSLGKLFCVNGRMSAPGVPAAKALAKLQ